VIATTPVTAVISMTSSKTKTANAVASTSLTNRMGLKTSHFSEAENALAI
jgi:hypothetical protein